MAMAACGEDEFGNLFADVHVENVHALRGFGSLHWSLQDESDTSTDIPPKDLLPESLPVASVHGCYANVTPAELHSSAIQCAPTKDNRAERENNSTNSTSDAAGIALRADDLATDSDDDLRIVLNPLHKVKNEGIADDSEDGEDFVVLTGNEVASGQVWRENSLMPAEDSAQAKVVGGEKVGLSANEQVQNQKASGVHPHICYGGQAYRRHYRYVRENGIGRVGPVSTGNARVANCKSSFAKSKRTGGRGGFTNSHRRAGGTGAVRGFSGPEYTLPHNKTVFDIDIDAFKEKPWRLTNVNVSDYFNFELDESSWKKYCKQLTQFCLEVTTQSKISVYEGGRIGQPTARDIQGGVGHQTSVDVQGQQFRDSDAIFLIDVKEDDMPQSCSEGHQANVGDACKVLESGGVNMKLASENKVRKLEKERPFVERSTRTRQKRSSAVLKEFSVNELQESGSVAAVSRLKTPSPATPPERLPTRAKRDIMVCGKIQSSSLKDGPQVGQADHNSSALHKRKENLQLAGYKTSLGGQSLNAALNAIRENHLRRRKDLKRGSIHAIAAQMINKKQRLDSHQANHGCRYASLLIKKISRVQTTKAISMPQVEADSIQKGNDLKRNNTSEFSNGRITSGKYFIGEHATQVAERQEKPVSMDNKRSKKKRKASCSEVRDVLQDIPCEAVQEKSLEKLKVKKSKKAHKGKERVKSKDKVHLPGCPNFKTGPEKNDLMQGMGNMSMVGFISKDNKFYWKKVDSLCQRNTEDQDAEKMSVIYQRHETKQKTEDRSVSDKNDGHFINVGGEECKKRILKTPNERSSDSIHAGTRGCDELLEGNVRNSWNALEVLRGKKKRVKHMVIEEMRLASSKTHVLANSTCETHANDSKQVLTEEQVILMDKRNQFEEKGRDLISGQLLLESEYKVQGLTDSALASGQRHKKKHLKKFSRKLSCKNSNKLTPLVDKEEQSNTFSKLKNNAAAIIRSRKVGNRVEDLDKGREAALESWQAKPVSTKVERTKWDSRKLLGFKRMREMEKHGKQTQWHCQETKSFWAFSV